MGELGDRRGHYGDGREGLGVDGFFELLEFEELDGLGHAVLGDREILSGEAEHGIAALILDVDGFDDELSGGAELGNVAAGGRGLDVGAGLILRRRGLRLGGRGLLSLSRGGDDAGQERGDCLSHEFFRTSPVDWFARCALRWRC